ncbi:MAG: threonylcarbamoyl-AMP synthase [Euryarchaeota archaeon]|nr:threonylcarbamoyl-AMP synthase [Euryarchaeota archaeon]MBV1730568.1 threonylcarbamoyl-AMP synthase [Methanobacterium sp.]MBU4548065.1 threonylcarbamoyl-AMP synthase [Euryarchaeota archaeon]MBU4608673.1 threonylcarbamoyl-AMP synthase [Euryarchaeota archaeon]MBV1755868.1 threonylcarbamoyl-AMP synthase [Methanobacterium sp.]
MEIINIQAQNPDKEKIARAIEVLKHGGIILYPTDTIYGLAVDINNESAIKKLYSLKKRPFNKPISICISDVDEISKFAYITPGIQKSVFKLLPGPFTIILEKKSSISSLLTAGTEKIGIRIPDINLCRDLCLEFPITSTSANISGLIPKESIEGIIHQLGDKIDLILNAGMVKNNQPSTVIDFTVKPPKILRQGAGKYQIY